MITLRKRTLLERLLRWLRPRLRKQQDEEQRRAIGWLVDHPEAPCSIDGKVIPHGYGTDRGDARGTWKGPVLFDRSRRRHRNP